MNTLAQTRFVRASPKAKRAIAFGSKSPCKDYVNKLKVNLHMQEQLPALTKWVN